MHFVFKVRMWLPFFNTPGKPSYWNPVLVFEGSCFYLHLLLWVDIQFVGTLRTRGGLHKLTVAKKKGKVFIYTCRCFQYFG